MNLLLSFLVTFIVNKSFASLEVEFEPFEVLISQAIVTDLDQRPVNITEVHGVGYERFTFIGDNSPPNLDARPTLLTLNDTEIETLAKDTSCGFCQARLLWGDSGVIQSPNYPEPYPGDVDCMWLLRTADEDARIELVCDDIQLESCGAQNGIAPTWRDYLIISPLWSFRKSWVYCGSSTSISAVRHTSLCDQMAITFRSDSNNKQFKGFHCTFKVI